MRSLGSLSMNALMSVAGSSSAGGGCFCTCIWTCATAIEDDNVATANTGTMAISRGTANTLSFGTLAVGRGDIIAHYCSSEASMEPTRRDHRRSALGTTLRITFSHRLLHT